MQSPWFEPKLVFSDWITAGQALKYKISKLQVKGNLHVMGLFINHKCFNKF